MVTSTTERLSTGTVTVVYPINENDSEIDPLLTESEYLPSASVVVPILVLTTIMFTPGIPAPVSSLTVPVMGTCANAAWATVIITVIMSNNLFAACRVVARFIGILRLVYLQKY